MAKLIYTNAFVRMYLKRSTNHLALLLNSELLQDSADDENVCLKSNKSN